MTHSLELASGFAGQRREDVLCLRAERGEGGRRTHRLIEAQPLPTSFGADLYRRVFGVGEDMTGRAG